MFGGGLLFFLDYQISQEGLDQVGGAGHCILKGLVIRDLVVGACLIFIELYQTSHGYNNERLNEISPKHHEDSPGPPQNSAWIIISVTDYKRENKIITCHYCNEGAPYRIRVIFKAIRIAVDGFISGHFSGSQNKC